MTISILLHLAGSSILQQTPWTSSRELSCSWDDRGFLVDGKPFVFTQDELAAWGNTAGKRKSRNYRIGSMYTKDADNDDADDEIVAPNDTPSDRPDDASSKIDVEEVTTTTDKPQVAAADDDTHGSTHDNNDDGGADDNDDDNDDDKEDEDDADVSSSGKGGLQSRSKPSKPMSSSSRVHNNAAAIAEVKTLWRDVIRGAREGCLDVGTTADSTISSSSSTVLSVVPGSSEDESSRPTQLSTVSVHVKSSLMNENGYDALIALRANGTDRASFLRQVRQQHVPLPSATRTSLIPRRKLTN